MSVEVVCPCGRTIRAGSEMAGKRVKCPECGRPVTVPGASRPTPDEKVATVATRCKCGRTIRAKKELAGKVVRCPECGDPVPIPDDASSGSFGNAPWAQPWDDLTPLAGGLDSVAIPHAGQDTSGAHALGLRTRRPIPVFAKRVFLVDLVLCALSLLCVSPLLLWAASAGSLRIENAPPSVETQGQFAFEESDAVASTSGASVISPFSVMVSVLIAIVSIFADSFMLARKSWAYYIALAALLLTIIGVVAPLPQLAEGVMGAMKGNVAGTADIGMVILLALGQAVRIGYLMLYATAVVRFSQWAASLA